MTPSRNAMGLAIGLLMTLIVPSIPCIAQTYGSDFHQVSVIVQTVNVAQIGGGIVNLNVTGADAIAGQDLMTVTDQSTYILWGSNAPSARITVSGVLASGSIYNITVKAIPVAPSPLPPSAEVSLPTGGADLLTGIGLSSGRADLLYTARVLASQGMGTESLSMTFTVTAP